MPGRTMHQTSDPAVHEPDWMSRLQRGDEAAFQALFHAHAPGLCSYLTRFVGSHDVAEDLVQDIFVQLWTRRESLEITGSVSGYLFRAAKNRALNQLRHQKANGRLRAALLVRSGGAEGSGENELLEMLDVQDAVSSLPGRMRMIFTLSRYNGMTHAAIAESLGLGVKTVEAQIGHALKILRGKLRRE